MMQAALLRKNMECKLLDVQNVGDKMSRWVDILLPALDKRTFVLSTDSRPFLKTVRDVFKKWPDYKSRGDIGSDILDAITNAIPFLTIPPTPKRKASQPNPYYAFGQYR